MNTDTVMNNTTTTAATEVLPASSVSVKVASGDEMRRFNFQGKSFQELKEIIAQLFGIPASDFTLQYQDDEKDRVTLSTDAELKEAIQLHKYILRFFVNSTKSSAGDLPSGFPFPHHPHHGHPHHGHHGVASPPPHVVAAEGEVITPPPFGPHGHGRHGRYGGHGRPFGGPGPFGGYGGHFPHHGPHKRCLDKEEKEAMKNEGKRWKKQRKCVSSSSSSSSSSEDEAQKVQRKEMRQLMKATKMSIKANWATIKQANPAQWPENRKLMMNEIKLAKRLIREQAKKPNTPSVAQTEQNASVTVTGAEMQA